MKRTLSRSERASKYAETVTGNALPLYTHRTISKEELELYLSNAYMAGWNDKTKMGLNKARMKVKK